MDYCKIFTRNLFAKATIVDISNYFVDLSLYKQFCIFYLGQVFVFLS